MWNSSLPEERWRPEICQHAPPHHQLIEFVGRFGAQDRLVGRAERCKHLCQSTGGSLVALAGFFAIDVVETERQIFGHASEERNRRLVERVGLIEGHDEHSDALACTDHGQCGGCARSRAACSLMPRFQAFIVEKVIADARFFGCERQFPRDRCPMVNRLRPNSCARATRRHRRRPPRPSKCPLRARAEGSPLR